MEQKQSKNKFILIKKPGGLETLELMEEDIPIPKSNEVLVSVSTCGVAMADIMYRKGTIPATYPVRPGFDIAGDIIAVGSAVTKFKIGDRVAALTFTGGYTEYISLPEDNLIFVPQGLDPAKVVSLVLNYTTAYNLLTGAGKLRSGDSVLIHGAAGGVGTAVLQLCKILGIKAYGTVSTEKIAIVEKEGGIPIDYKKTNFIEEILRLTLNGVDAVLDPIGGSHLFASYKALKPKGRLILFGVSAAVKSDGNPKIQLIKSLFPFLILKLLPKTKSTAAYSLKPKNSAQVIAQMLELLKAEKINPIIAKKFPLTEVRAAHQFLEFEKPVGKVILETTAI